MGVESEQAVEPLVGGVGARGGAIGAGVHPRLVGGVRVSQGRQVA
jgi:hypothetical protein